DERGGFDLLQIVPAAPAVRQVVFGRVRRLLEVVVELLDAPELDNAVPEGRAYVTPHRPALKRQPLLAQELVQRVVILVVDVAVEEEERSAGPGVVEGVEEIRLYLVEERPEDLRLLGWLVPHQLLVRDRE